MSYLEANLKTELVAAFENAGYICWKYPDNARGVKKPCDLICGIHGQFVALETKLVKVGTASSKGRWHDKQIVVKYTDVRTNQHTALRKAVMAGSFGFVVGAIYDRCDCHRLAYAIDYARWLQSDRSTPIPVDPASRSKAANAASTFPPLHFSNSDNF